MSMESILLIGQSNMAGRAPLGSVPDIASDRIFMFKDNKWLPMKEPIHQDKREAGIGLAASFAAQYVKHQDKKLGLIPCAVGGTSLSQWHPDGDLFKKAVTQAKAAQKSGEIIGVLWHQGESDSHTYETASAYEKNFKDMLNAMMLQLELHNIPVIVGELGEYLKNTEGFSFYTIVNQTLHKLARENRFIGIASAEGLTDKGDGLHFDAQSLRNFGVRYYEAWEYIKTTLL